MMRGRLSGKGCGVCVVASLSPLRGLFSFHTLPAAFAVGCNLAPLRG